MMTQEEFMEVLVFTRGWLDDRPDRRSCRVSPGDGVGVVESGWPTGEAGDSGGRAGDR